MWHFRSKHVIFILTTIKNFFIYKRHKTSNYATRNKKTVFGENLFQSLADISKFYLKQNFSSIQIENKKLF